MPADMFSILRLKYHGREERLTHIGQLSGLMNITNGNMALKYARIQTNLVVGAYFDGAGVEIIRKKDMRTLPQYGLGLNVVGLMTVKSGYCGVLSSKAYRAGSFSPPVVKQTAGGFQIERWLMRMIWLGKNHQGGVGFRVLRVREFVGARWLISPNSAKQQASTGSAWHPMDARNP